MCAIANTIDLRYSYYFLTSLRLDQFDRSTAIPGLNRDDAYELVVLLPPLAEQRRIVAKIEELFSELDKGVENLEKVREQLKVYRQAVLKHAFEGNLTARWREQNKDKLEAPEQLLTRIKQEREANYERQIKGWNAAVNEREENSKIGQKLPKPKNWSTFPLSPPKTCRFSPNFHRAGLGYHFLQSQLAFRLGPSDHSCTRQTTK